MISYTKREEFYYLQLSLLKKFWERMLEGGRKSFRYEELSPEFFLEGGNGAMIPYLDGLQKDLSARE